MTDTRTSNIDLVRKFPSLRALVIGDAMLDSYIDGRATRLCKEGPVPVLVKKDEHHAPGGAANVAVNLRALGADVVFIGLLGDDEAGAHLRQELRSRNVDDRWLISDPDCSTIRKMRILADDQYVVRVDDGETTRCSADGMQRLIESIETEFSRCDLVVIPDYGYGTASDEVIETLKRLRAARPTVLAVDAKDVRRFASAHATIVTPNLAEACAAAGEMSSSPLPSSDMAGVERVGRRLAAVLDTEHVIVTLAQDGVLILDRSGNTCHLPAHPVPHAGDVGAGDSFISATALAMAAGADVERAARIGIDSASIAVTQRRTSAVDHQELLRRVSLDGSTPSMSLKNLATVLEAERYAGKSIVFTNGVFDILHAGHVQILKRAKQFGDILVVGINSDASVRRLKGKTRPINHERDRLALVAALDSVDHAVLFDDDTPAELIRLLRPHVHVKGGDYTEHLLPEIDAVREAGARVEIIPLVEGRSTTRVIQKIVTLVTDGAIETAS